MIKQISMISRLSLILMSITFIFISCRRSQDVDAEIDTSFTNNEIVAEISFEDIDKVADEIEFTQVVKSNANTDVIILGCGTVDTVPLANDTMEITIDFGTTNCQGSDGKFRKGKVIIKRIGRYAAGPDYYREVTTENYFVNENEVDVTRKILLTDTTVQRVRKYKVSMQGKVVLANGDGEIQRTTDRKRTWYEGVATRLDRSDDAYTIEGSISGTHTDGRTYTSVIGEPLYKRGNCQWIDKGVVNFTPEGKVTRVIDFGDGECDDKASVSIGGAQTEILL